MNRSRSPLRASLFFLAVVSLVLSACTGGQGSIAPNASAGTFEVDLTFREFYNMLGGQATLGPAIGEAFEQDGVKIQYTASVGMQFDPAAEASSQYALLPIGAEIQSPDPAIALPEQANARTVDGYLIYDEFVALYDEMQGERFVGAPLTQVRVNADRGRIEQYFTNLGFYRLLDDKAGTVHLLAYGSWKCGSGCVYAAGAQSVVSTLRLFAEPLLSDRLRLGLDLLGQPLSDPYIAADGMLEQVYENAVIYADPANLNAVALRSITVALGYAEQPLVAKVDDDRLVFFPLDGELGHLVPAVFEQYITQHGGTEISGQPTTEIFAEGSVYRQCFTNLCLDYDANAAENAKVRPAALGTLYLQANPALQTVIEAEPTQPAPDTLLSIAEAHPTITSQQEQQVTITVTTSDGATPLANVEGKLTVSRPDGSQASYDFPLTDANGQATVSLPSIRADNGTLVPYQVCIQSATFAARCTIDSYLIWGN